MNIFCTGRFQYATTADFTFNDHRMREKKVESQKISIQRANSRSCSIDNEWSVAIHQSSSWQRLPYSRKSEEHKKQRKNRSVWKGKENRLKLYMANGFSSWLCTMILQKILGGFNNIAASVRKQQSGSRDGPPPSAAMNDRHDERKNFQWRNKKKIQNYETRVSE